MSNDQTNVPRSIGIIMDGNRRWAKARNLPTLEGHRKGYEKIREVMHWARESGVEEVIIYAFSTENWNRAAEEVRYLMTLLDHAFQTWIEEVIQEGRRIRFIGERTRLTPEQQKNITEAEERTKDGSNGTLVIAFSYGGRAEILAGIHSLLSEGKKSITEEDFSNALWSKGLADPDLIIRTSGERRLSNFLTWQSVYSELFFTDTLWPDFSKEEFEAILAEYASRERRRGK